MLQQMRKVQTASLAHGLADLKVSLASRQAVALLLLQVGVVPQQLVQAAPEGEEHQDVEDEPLGDVDDHLAQGDLERPQVRVDGEDVDQLQEGRDHSGPEHA